MKNTESDPVPVQRSEGEKTLLSAGSSAPVVAQPDMMETLSRETSSAYQSVQVVAMDQEEAEKEVLLPEENRTVKVFCHKCQQKLDVTNLRPFSRIECPSCSESLLIPKWFNDYLLEEPCGTGGMAQVYRALDIALDREVAIKILKDGIRHDSVQAQRFLREAKMAATLNHNAVIPIYTCGTWGGHTYLVMQYMGGISLEARFNASNCYFEDLDQVLEWFHDVAEGLEHASGHGIIHHDVKPGNILLDRDDNAKIGDFGLAQSAADQQDDSEIPEEEWVTPYYVSPERISSGKEDFRGDIYSLGATFYHLLTGRTPFEHENLEELIWMRTREMPAAPIVKRKDIPESISSLILEMMNIDPARRPSYRRIITVLEEVLNNSSDGPVVLQRDIVLPQMTSQTDTSQIRMPLSPSGIQRVKSPSAVLKVRKGNEIGNSPWKKNPLEFSDDSGTAVQEPLNSRDLQDHFSSRNSTETSSGIKYLLLWSGLIFLTVIVLAALIYSIVEFLQSGI